MAAVQDNKNDLEGGLLGGNQTIKNASLEIRQGFVRKVYGILTAQILLTVLIAAPLQQVSTQWLQDNIWLLYVSLGMTFVTICAMSCCQNVARSYPTNYIFLFTFTAFEGVCVGFVSAASTWQTVALAAAITTIIFFCMTLYACFTKTDFTGCGPYLMGAMMTLFSFGFLLCVMSAFGCHFDWMLMVYDAFGALLFTFYIVYDTQMILGETGGFYGSGHQIKFGIDDYVFAALNLYLDIINLFLFILRMLDRKN